MGRSKITVRKSTGGKPPRKPFLYSHLLPKVNLDSFISIREEMMYGQNHKTYEYKHFVPRDTETFAKMAFLCTEGKLTDLKAIVDDLDNESDEDDNDYNNAKHIVLQNAQDLNTGNRIIDIAALNGHLHIMKYLLCIGAQIEARNPWKVTHNALDSAIIGGHGEMVKYLIEHGANAENKLYLAIKKGQIKICETLLKGHGFNKANIDALSENGFNALHLVTKGNMIVIVRKLIAFGADPNIKSGREGYGRSTLHFAAENHNCSLIEYLIDYGANVFQKDTNGLTALDIVKKGITTSIPDLRESQTNHELPNSKEEVIEFLTRKMRKSQETENDVNSMKDIHSTKKRKLDHSGHTKDSNICDQTVIPMIEVFMNRSLPFLCRISCLMAIDAFITFTKNPSHCQPLLKMDIVDEIAIAADEIISKVDKESDKHLSVIAKILVKINKSTEGKKLFGEIKIPYGSLERLKSEMEMYESTSYTFEADDIMKIKSEIKLEKLGKVSEEHVQ